MILLHVSSHPNILQPHFLYLSHISVVLASVMPPVSVDDVKISSNGNSVTIGDSVKIVVSGSSPTRVKVSRDNISSEQVIKLNDLNTKNSTSAPIPKKSEGNHLNRK